MAEIERKTPRPALWVAGGALVVVGYVALASCKKGQDPSVPPVAAGWHGAMELYRSLALWAGKRAMLAELHYWRAVG